MARYKTSKKNKGKYKSHLEVRFATKAKTQGLNIQYEANIFPYVRPSHYTPDWKIGPQTYIETKGYFSPSDRAKILTFLEQYPGIKLYLIFGNAKNKLNKNSRTTYGEWAKKHGIEFGDIRESLKRDWWQKTNFGNLPGGTPSSADSGETTHNKSGRRKSRGNFSSDT